MDSVVHHAAEVFNDYALHPPPPPPLITAIGSIQQMALRADENLYAFAMRGGPGPLVVPLDKPPAGGPATMRIDNPIYDLMKKAFFRKLIVEVGYRNYGHDPQTGMDKLVIDRVSLTN